MERPGLLAHRNRSDIAAPLQEVLGSGELRRIWFEPHTARNVWGSQDDHRPYGDYGLDAALRPVPDREPQQQPGAQPNAAGRLRPSPNQLFYHGLFRSPG